MKKINITEIEIAEAKLGTVFGIADSRIAVADCVTFEAVSAICIPYFKYNG